MAGPFLSPDETAALYGHLSAPPVAPGIDAALLRQQLSIGPPELDPGAMVRQQLVPAGPPPAPAATPLPTEMPQDTVSSPGGVVRRPAGPPPPAAPAPSRFAGVGMGVHPLQRAVNEARAQQVHTIEGQRELVGDQGAARAGRMMAMSSAEEDEATRLREQAEWDQSIALATQKKMDAYLEKNNQIADEIARSAPDPTRLMRNADAAQQFAMAIGAVAGGMLSALNGGPNEFLTRLDRAIDRDIDAQVQAISNKKTALAERRSIFGQMLQEFGDVQQAAKEHRAALYQAAQHSLKAKAEAYGVPEARAEAELARNAIQGKLDVLNIERAEGALMNHQRNIAAAATRQRQAEKEARDLAFKWAELGIKRDEVTAKGLEAHGKRSDDLTQRFVATGKDPQGNPTGYVARSADEAAKKEKSREATQKSINLIDQALAIRNERGVTGRLIRGSPLFTPQWRSDLEGLRTMLQLNIKETGHLGTLDKGAEAFLDRLVPELDSIGASSEEKLLRLKAILEDAARTEADASAGQQGQKAVNPETGREGVVLGKGFNAPPGAMPKPKAVR